MTRYVTDEAEEKPRFSLYRLCKCPTCGGSGKEAGQPVRGAGGSTLAIASVRCGDCRGEGKQRDEVCSTDTEEGVGVALITCAREGEWLDENGDPCGFGLLDREGEVGKKWLILPWQPSARNVHDAAVTLAKSKRKA